jgi:hypothetical protein
MLNPIKRVWVPKKAQASAEPAVPDALVAPVLPPLAVPQAPKPLRHVLSDDDMPEPDVEEKNSDSIWAEFDSIFSPEAGPK